MYWNLFQFTANTLLQCIKARLTTFLVVNYANLQFAVGYLTTIGNTCSHLHFKKAPKEEGFLAACEVTALHLKVQTADWSTVEDCWRCVVLHPLDIFVRVPMSQAVHHGQEVVSFAAGTGGLISRLCELSHDLSQLCISLLVLKDNVIHQSQCQSGHQRDLHFITVNPVRLAKPHISDHCLHLCLCTLMSTWQQPGTKHVLWFQQHSNSEIFKVLWSALVLRWQLYGQSFCH